jgi:hypothetical protein
MEWHRLLTRVVLRDNSMHLHCLYERDTTCSATVQYGTLQDSNHVYVAGHLHTILYCSMTVCVFDSYRVNLAIHRA